MSGIWKLSVRDEFSAGHALRHYEGKCEKLHGHNFLVEVAICGNSVDTATGMLIDFKILKNELKNILNKFDHAIINELPPFDAINPSSENMAKEIWSDFSAFIASMQKGKTTGLRVFSVTVSEKSSQSATFYGNASDLWL